MIVRNLKYYHTLPFEEYLKIPGVSYSSLNGFSGPPSTGMQLGSRVHQYLNEPKEYDWQDATTVRAIAGQLKSFLGGSYDHLEKEVAFTAEFIHNDMLMTFKGRADMMKAGRLILDVKILSGDLEKAIERFGYHKQLSGYCLATGANVAIILAFNKIKKRVEVKTITPDAAFWEYQTVKHGRPL